MSSSSLSLPARALLAGALLAGALVLTAGCAESVDDLDLTQGNLVAKADLAGEWYLLQSVVGVPPTTGFTFIGETGRMERVEWEIQRDLLIAHRSYPLVPGADAPSTDAEPDRYSPVAIYAIEGHFDVIRQFNEQTGEQSNVIVEDGQYRLWHERDYLRVDWSRNLVGNFDFVAPIEGVEPVALFEEPEQGGDGAVYFERDGERGTLAYFDVTGRLYATPEPWACYLTWWGLGAYDCAPAEITIRTSFARVPSRPVYEPFHYDDQLMSRFGFFRSERFGYDEQRGVVDAAREYLVNRHHVFEASLDADGQAIPIADRAVRTVPYYLGPDFPDDEALLSAARETMAQWDAAARRGIAAAQGRSVDDLPAVFVLCSNPVAEGDPAGCGDPGFAPRPGDLRYSTLTWVDTYTVDGLLGYGPSATDPITGEIVSGRAFVYGAAVNEWAAHAVDVLRFFNDDLDTAQLVRGEQFADAVRTRAERTRAETVPDEALARVPLSRPLRSGNARPRKGGTPFVRRPPRPTRPGRSVESLRPFEPGRLEARLEAARAAGRTPGRLTPEVERALARVGGASWGDLSTAARDALDPIQTLSPIAFKQRERLRRRARARSIDLRDMVRPASIDGLVRKYAGQTDYDAIWRDLRAEIFAAVAEHEVGHTLGLRHNFAGSYDSLNYPDAYWRLREENLADPSSLADIYALSSLTEAQRDGGMRQLQYSSIMDYGYSWSSDLSGIGRYDEAAIVFGYTAGTRAEGAAPEPGLVEVFEKGRDALGDAAALLGGSERGHLYEDSGLPSINILERVHYTRVAGAFPSLDDLAARRLVPYADYLGARAGDDADRPVKVPYLFCSDEWEEGILSCNAFDQGADPFEMTRTLIDHYRAYYWFDNFRRDRVDFDIWQPLDRSLWSVFLPLSNIFQDWYVAPWGQDDLFDRTYDLARDAGFNLLAEVLRTPPYGTWCETGAGTFSHLSDEIAVQGEADDDRCVGGGGRLRVAPGDGRRRFSLYDDQAGYYFEDKPLESGHYWTALAAIWAVLDPEARLVGLEGDAGVFSISYYDWFADEIDGLFTALLTQDHAAAAPRAVAAEGSEDATLRYPPLAQIYDPETDALYDPETGAAVAEMMADGAMLESETSFSVQSDLLWYGMLLSTASYSTRFNDGLNVFRGGDRGEVTVGEGDAEVHRFTDPLGGTTYSAVQPRCDDTEGTLGLCDACFADTECEGYTGEFGGVFCQPIEEGSDTFFCLQDCTDDAGLCGAGETCDDVGNCVPDSCEERGSDAAPSAACRLFGPRDSGGVQLVKRGQSLAAAYDEALLAWYTYTGPDEAEDDRLARAYFGAEFELRSHLDLLETLIATYDIFGRVY